MIWSALLLSACTTGLPDTDTDPTEDSGDSGDAATTFELKVVGWNVEGDDADIDTLSSIIAEVEDEVIWGFSEVPSTGWAIDLRDAAQDDLAIWNHLYGGSGWSKRLTLAWNADVLELVGSEELEDINVGGSVRAPLVGTFEHKASGVRFKAMVNHLWRGEENSRHQQATMLNDWVEGQTLPVIAVGDYNFDKTLDGTYHDKGFDNMVNGGAWEWVKPSPNAATHCGGSVLDFTFVGNDAQDWEAEATVLADYEGYCPDSDRRSDHRPVQAVFQVPVD